MWRYGWSHPDEDLLGVIDAAGDALRAQIASASAVLSGEALAEAKQIDLSLEKELGQEIPELALLLGFEARINALYPPAVQRRRAWMLRERFERVAPARAVIEYWASNPPEPDGEAVIAEESRRADAAARNAASARDAAAAARDAAREALGAATASEQAAAKTMLAEAEQAAGAAALVAAVADARRGIAHARGDLHRAKRELGDAVAGARAAALLDAPSQAAAQIALDGARRAHGAALDTLDAREETLEALGESPATGPTSAVIDADAQTLLGYIHSNYMMSIGREKAVRDLMRWLIMRFWSANAVALVVLLIVFILVRLLPGGGFTSLGNLVIGLFFIAAVGRIGATMSVVQRLQSAVAGNVLSGDSLLEVTRLRTGKNGMNLALFSGAVFALLLYAIFATGAPAMIGFDNGIFPEMNRPEQPGASTAQQTQEAKPNEKDEVDTAAEDGDAKGSVVGDELVQASPEDSVETQAAESRFAKPESAGNAGAVASEAGNRSPSTRSKPSGVARGDGVGQDVGPVTVVLARPWYSRIMDTAPSAQCKANQSCDPFQQFAEALGFPGRSDFFKLLLWAFLAGFAERLVPDVLDSITRRTRAGVTVAEQAAATRNRTAAAGRGLDNGRTPETASEPGGRAKVDSS